MRQRGAESGQASALFVNRGSVPERGCGGVEVKLLTLVAAKRKRGRHVAMRNFVEQLRHWKPAAGATEPLGGCIYTRSRPLRLILPRRRLTSSGTNRALKVVDLLGGTRAQSCDAANPRVRSLTAWEYRAQRC